MEELAGKYDDIHSGATLIDHKLNTTAFGHIKIIFESIVAVPEFWKEGTRVKLELTPARHARYKDKGKESGDSLSHVVSLRAYVGYMLVQECNIIKREHERIKNGGDVSEDGMKKHTINMKFVQYCDENIFPPVDQWFIDDVEYVAREKLGLVKKNEMKKMRFRKVIPLQDC